MRPLAGINKFGTFIDAFILSAAGLGVIHLPASKEFISQKPHVMSFASSVAEDVHIDTTHVLKLLSQEDLFVGSTPHTTQSIRILCQMLLIATRAWLEEHPKFPVIHHEPSIEFFRHIRNGAAHDNSFFLKEYKDGSKEPVRDAAWQGKKITRELQGKEVLFSFLTAGDIIYLLDDIGAFL